MRLLIFGSCVSRDAMRYAAPPRAVQLVDYYARSSLASLACEPLRQGGIDLGKLESPFQQRMVRRDHSKILFADIGRQAYDLMLMDLIDERFDVHVGPAGGCTISSEMRRVEPHIARWPGRILKSGSAEFLALWTDGWQRLVAALRATGRLDRLRVNAVLWSRRTQSGADFGDAHPEGRIDAANATLLVMYRVMARDLVPSQILSFDELLMRGADEHRWGRSPFHYVDSYYIELLRQLGIDGARLAD